MNPCVLQHWMHALPSLGVAVVVPQTDASRLGGGFKV
jgi:hypothetical protein